MKKNWIILVLLSLGLCLAGCDKQPAPNTEPDPTPSGPSQEELEKQKLWLYANTFARNTMNLYYLWCEEIKSDLKAWKDTEEPIAKVAKIRYKNAKGEDIDRWTMLTDDFESFYGSVSGNGKTYGFDFVLYYYDSSHTTLCAVVTYTYPGSPAAEAGLKRGDAIVTVNGKEIPAKNYSNILYNELMGGDKLTAGVLTAGGTQATLTMNSKEMYENPVILSKVFDCGDKKVGYLVFTSFTLDACKDLIDVCKSFKEAGVSELILDLRYNGGGFVITEQVLASMLAPEAEVLAGSVMATEVYNAALTEFFRSRGTDTNTYFKTEYDFNSDNKSYKFSTKGANLGLDKLYAIISSGSASASEALICDLYPYMEVKMVGEQSHGKYCSGLMMQATDFFDDYAEDLGTKFATEGKKYTKNWGLYVMYSRFADKDGKTLCMPDGLTPDYKVADDPLDSFQLGDPQETMLAKALSLCGYKATAQAARRGAALQLEPVAETFERPGSGLRIQLPEQLPNRRFR